MTLPLPNLDDRRWADLVEEARALLPVYAPEWTDHNIHDPGITVLELLAWVAEMDLFALNRIPDRHKRKFLALVDIEPTPPRAARSLLSVSLRADGAAGGPHTIPADVIFSGTVGTSARHVRTRTPIVVAASRIASVQTRTASGLRDVTDQWRRGESFEMFGPTAARGAELYLRFDRPLPPGQEVTLQFVLDGPRADEHEWERILGEFRCECHRTTRPHPCATNRPAQPDACRCETRARTHPGVRLEWAHSSDDPGGWRPFDPTAGEVVDETRALTLNGQVRLTPSKAISTTQHSTHVGEPGYYVRVRFVAGTYDAAPTARRIALNAATIVQSFPAGPLARIDWSIAKGTMRPYPEPTVGKRQAFDVRLNAQGEVVSLTLATGEAAPRFLVLDYVAPAASTCGRLVLEGVGLPGGSGLPIEQVRIPGAPVELAELELWTLEDGRWHRWQARADFDASRPADRHFTIDASTGWIAFGDGARGLVLPNGARPFAIARGTDAADGNVAAGVIDQLLDCAHNRALIANFDAVAADLGAIANVTDATGGSAAEPLDHAIGRAVESVEAVTRAITLADFEQLALQSPGTRLARAKAWGNVHPDLPCYAAPGVVTVVIVPAMKLARPSPSAATLRIVTAYLERRRTIGTHVEVVGPRYTEVAVRAAVRAVPGTDPAALRRAIETRLTSFLNPLDGGPDAAGWPFGRDVFRAEILKVIRSVPGVDRVDRLGFVIDGCDCHQECGNVCIGPIGLVAAGTHEIEVK